MIVCYIGGKAAYPSTQSSIKVTLENPAIKELESRTQELTFPLSVVENRKVFGAVNRIDVSKGVTTYSPCRLVADNLPIIEGVGTVTSYTDEEVKLQIREASAKTAFPDKFSSLYIDRILDYVSDTTSANEATLQAAGGTWLVTDETAGYVTEDDPVIPVYDEANGRLLNDLTVIFSNGNHATNIVNYAPQPLLKDAVAAVVYALGYSESGTLGSFDYKSPLTFFEQYPWNKLRIVNTNCSFLLKNQLPHWTAAKFFTELQNLFNISFKFDESAHTVTVTSNIAADTDGAAVCYDCLDEFSSDYDEDGETLLSSSNLEYNLSGSGEWNYADALTQEVISQFDIVDYASEAALYNVWFSLTEKERLTQIFRTPTMYHFGTHKTLNDGDTIIYRTDVTLAGLVRNAESSESLTLNVSPTCLAQPEHVYTLGTTSGTIAASYSYYCPTTDQSKSMLEEDYVTVEDIVEGSDSDKTDEQERMELFFVLGATAKIIGLFNSTMTAYFADCYTYVGSNPYKDAPDVSLALCDSQTSYTIGRLHSQAAKAENRQTIVVKFLSDTLPDPRDTFMFRGKRFLCSKVEVEITADGVSKIKTGYFFEVNS